MGNTCPRFLTPYLLVLAVAVVSCGGGGDDPSGPRWTHPSSLADNISPDDRNAHYPRVAIGYPGDAIIVWHQEDYWTTTQIFKSLCRNEVWTHPSGYMDNISRDETNASYPQVVMNEASLSIIVWRQFDSLGATPRLQIFMSDYGTVPTGLADNISPDGQDALYPRVAAANGNSTTLVVWQQSNGANTQIFKSEKRDGGWTHPSSLSDNISPDGQNAANPQVAMSSTGTAAIIVWQQSNGAHQQIFKSEYRNGSWTHPSSLSDTISPDGANAAVPQVAMNSAGTVAIVVWSQSDAAGISQIFKSEYSNGAWTHPSTLSDNISPDGQSAASPRVAMDNNGNAVIAWRQYDSNGSIHQIFKSDCRGGAWTHPSSLSDNISPDGQDAANLELAMEYFKGDALIVWQQSNGTHQQIFKSERRNGAWTYPAGLSDNISPDGQDANNPHVDIGPSGEAIIVWEQSDGREVQIFKSEYR